MLVAIVNRGRIEIKKSDGGTFKTLAPSGGAVSAYINADETLVVYITAKGIVEICKTTGGGTKRICQDCTDARWCGNDIQVTTIKGHTELWRVTGGKIRTIS